MAQKILIAEKNEFANEIIERFAEKSGHSITIYEDGKAAYAELLKTEYDVALIDHQLPGLNGIELVSRYMQAAGNRNHPHFIAMSANPSAFLSTPGHVEYFEALLPKPLDLEKLAIFIDCVAIEEDTKGPQTSTGRDIRIPGVFEGADLDILYYPEDFTGRAAKVTRQRLQNNFVPDCLVVKSVAHPSHLLKLEEELCLQMVPIVDVTGQLRGRVDLCGAPSLSFAEKVYRLAEEFRERRDRVHPDFASSHTCQDKLMTQCYVRGAQLFSSLDVESTQLVTYPLLRDPDEIIKTASALVEHGMLAKTLKDRVHVCPCCSGARLIVREVCCECGDLDLREAEIVHHFTCAYQDLRTKFKQDDKLVCPKCAKELRRFGKDYDLPGSAFCCTRCDSVMAEPEIEFKCLDCNTRTKGDLIATRDIYDYSLTARGRESVEVGITLNEAKELALNDSDVPMPILAWLRRHEAQTNQKFKSALVMISYPGLYLCEKEHGAGLIRKVRQHLIHSLGEIVPCEIMAMGRYGDYLAYSTDDKATVIDSLRLALAEVTREVSVDLAPEVKLYRRQGNC